ncbi:MAG: hypothetical protein JWM85_3608 [Acidimicrobiaceae bacterium]|nr:hypothetical protein [Acidimicrobiaceae bacterium]
MSRRYKEQISEGISRLHMQPLPDPVLGNVDRPLRNAGIHTMVTYEEREAIRYIAGYEGITTSVWIRNILIQALYSSEKYQQILRER